MDGGEARQPRGEIHRLSKPSIAWDLFLLLLRLMGCIAGDVKVAEKGWHGWQNCKATGKHGQKTLAGAEHLVRNIGGNSDRDFTMPQSKLSGFAAQHRDDRAW